MATQAMSGDCSDIGNRKGVNDKAFLGANIVSGESLKNSL